MLTEELRDILELSRKFAAKEIGPHMPDIDLTPSPDWTRSLWTKSRDVGFPGLLIPEEFGGFGQSDLCAALVVDVLAGECAGVASVFAHHFAAARCIASGSDEQKKTFLPMLANADGAEPVIGTVTPLPYLDENRLTLAERDGKLYLSGTSQLTGNAFLARHFCVFFDEGSAGADITCIVAEPGKPGCRVGETAGFTGLKLNPFAPVIFEDMEVPPGAVIGERRGAAPILQATEDLFYNLLSAAAMGAARTAYRKARAYAEERYQFGKMIVRHQEIQRILGTILMKLSVGTSGYLRAITHNDSELPYSSADPRFAKSYCTDAAVEIVLDAIQVHGGYGYMHDYGVEKIMRDVKVLSLLGGSSPRLHIQAVAKDLE
ncbi:MAG: acyl-CoA/acyl-ACP dehydrogenase [Deltaproteobacteria bacterium]|nr:acyl-CoA/acyl-ACP dehydrogenase [Deltaproteobacteria bacterium]